MKVFFALALLVSVALCNPTSHYAWEPEHEYMFRWSSSQITGLEDIRAQYGGMELSSLIRVQVFPNYTLRVKFVSPKFVVVNKDLPIVHGRPQIPEGHQELPEEYRRPLETPFEAHFKAGVFEAILVEENEPVAVTNIKKALLSQLQMDLSASRRNQINANEIPKSTMAAEVPTFFTTEESSILGDCETIYTVTPMAKYQAKEMESKWDEEEKELRELGVISGPESRGEEACRERKYFEVTKTKNFDNCRERPVFQQWTGIKTDCDVSKASCKDMFTHMSSTRYVVCGTIESFYVREAITENTVVSIPIGWSTHETLKSTARVNLFLIQVKSSDFTPLPKPNQPKKLNSLVYQYPKSNHLSSDEPVSKEVRPGSEGESPFLPILPKPDMHSPSNLMPISIPKEELRKKVVEEVKAIVRTILDKTETCTNKKDVASYMSTIVQSLRSLNFDDLKHLEEEIARSQNSESSTFRLSAEELFQDMLTMVGTNPAVLLLKEKIESVEKRNKAYVIGNTIRNVRTPTKELFKTVFEMVKSVKQQDKQAYQAGVLELSNLVYSACVHPSTSNNQYPVRIYGRFCSKDSSFIVEEYIPYLERELESIRGSEGRNDDENVEVEKYFLITALGKIGQKNILLPLTRIIEGKQTTKPMARSLAVYSLKRLAKRDPSVVRPILLALIDNLAETTEVRIAAVAILPWSQPSVAELQKVAMRSWFEPSKQVASFVYSTLKSLTQTEVPELKPVGLKARTLLHLVKPFQYGIQFSHNLHSQKFVQYLQTAASSELNYVITENSLIPNRVSFSSKLYGGLWEIQGLSFSVYTHSMDQIVDNILKFLGYESQISDMAQTDLTSIDDLLKLKSTKKDAAMGLAQLKVLGLEGFYKIDRTSYIGVLEKLSEILRNSQSSDTGPVEFQKTRLQNLINLESFGPSESGFLLYVRKTVPVVLAYKGVYNIATQDRQAKFDITPIANIKIETNLGVLSPFTKQFIGAGVEAGLHAIGCATIKAEMVKRGQFALTLKKPEEVNGKVELMHIYMKPYTVARDLTRLVPTCKDSSVKIIQTMRPKEKEYRFGQRVGIDMNMKIAHDYERFDAGTILSKLPYHNLQSLINTGLMAPSVKYMSIQLVWDADSSATKEINTRISYVEGKRVGETGDLEISAPFKQDHYSHEEELRRICSENHNSKSDAQVCQQEGLRQLEQATDKVERICEEIESGEGSDEAKRVCRKTVHVCEEAKRICEKSGRQEQGVCQEKKDECLSRRQTVQHMEKVLREKSGSGRVYGMNIQTSYKSRFEGQKNIEVLGVFGRKSDDTLVKTFVDLKFVTPQSPVYTVEAMCETKFPEVLYRWNLESLLKEDINMKNKITVRYGRKGSEKKTFELKTNWEKTEEQKENVRKSPEFQRCHEEFRQGRLLSSVCMEVRHQAASVDKVDFQLRIPKSVQQNVWTQRLMSLIKSYLWTNLKMNTSEESSKHSELRGEIKVSYTGKVATLVIKSPQNEVYSQIRVPRPIRGFFPMSLRNGITSRVIQKITRDQAPASCRIEPEWISTFDNKTYKYTMNECEHLLFKDCTGLRPLAVLAQGVNSAYRNVKVILGSNIVSFNWGKKHSYGSKVDIKINEVETQIPVGELYVKKSKDGQVVLKIFRSKDSVVSVYNPVEGLEVFYDGKMVEIVAPQILHNRACGLCGDLNLENTADLKTPQQCLMKNTRFNAYSYMLMRNGCEGIPSQDREEYNRELSHCSYPKNLPTPLELLARATIKNRKPITISHLIKMEENRVCISKRPIRVCTGSCHPLEMKIDYLEFACLSTPSAKAQQFVARAKAGEIIDELIVLPTVFSMMQRVPSKCSRDNQSGGDYEQSSNYRTTPRY
uniref:Vitellogenin 1 n=1 Tax=Tigriopus kingsejongensis TaxID=1133412 RepID=A0A0U2JFQ6_9MAXI|nr:vitellogenin 1 [Tigriopus kingsejongensis]